VILHCLYSRHGDGMVRQRHLEQIIPSGEPWVVPFVVQLVGEYVLEILQAIRNGVPDLATPGSAPRLLYGEFVARNPSFFARTERRVVSYWSCYHRHQYPAYSPTRLPPRISAGQMPCLLAKQTLRVESGAKSGCKYCRPCPLRERHVRYSRYQMWSGADLRRTSQHRTHSEVHVRGVSLVTRSGGNRAPMLHPCNQLREL
jgi:hypothetical protein